MTLDPDRAPNAPLPVSPEVWDAMVGDDAVPMVRSAWVRATAETLASPGDLRFPSVGPADAPDAIAPLGRTADRRAIAVLGAEDLWEATHLPVRDDAELVPLARALVRIGRPIHFGHVPADSPLLAALRNAGRGRGTIVTRSLPKRAMPRIELDESWVTPESHLRSRRRSDLRRMRRRAEELGTVTSTVITPTADQLGPLIDEVFAIEAAGWKGRAGTAIARDTRLAGFFRRYAELAREAGHLRIARLRIDDRTAAVQLAVECGDRYWLLKIGYDEEFGRCSPGSILIADTIAHAAAQGLRAYEFLGKESEWTTVWTTDATDVVAVRYYPWNPRGIWSITREGLRRLERKRRERSRERAAAATSGDPGEAS